MAVLCLLMNTISPAFAAENSEREVNEVSRASVSNILSVSDVQTAKNGLTVSTIVKSTSAEPYTLTVEDVNIERCREDDEDSNTPYIDAVRIVGWKADARLPQYKNIVIPETLPFDKPVLDDDGKEKLDEKGNVVTETVEMPVIKAFLNPGDAHANIEKVTFSKNLRNLDSGFGNCENLSEVVIPEESALESFCEKAFANTAIKECFIPEGVKELPDGIFSGCHNLTTITFAEGSKLDKIGVRAFAESALTKISLPDTVSQIGESAFSQCALEEILLSNAIEEIPEYAFKGCAALKNITFGSSLKAIGQYAFEDTSIEELVIPDTVTFIGRGAFNNIQALRSVKIGKGLKELGGCADLSDPNVGAMFQNDVNIETVVFSEGIEKIGDDAFKWSAKIETLVIPSTVKNIGRNAFGGDAQIHALSELTFAESSQLENIFTGAFSFNSIKHLKLPVAEKPFKLWDQVFEANGELQDVDLGNCKELGSATGYQTEELYETEGAVFGTFKFCRKLRSVKFGEELEIINHGTFLSCDSLVGPIEFPANLKKIGHSAFEGCSQIEDVTFNEGLETIGNKAFIGCDLHEINLPDSVTKVGERCFEGNIHVGKIKFSASMTVIPNRFLDNYAQDAAAYSYTHNSQNDVGVHGMLKELTIPDNIKEIGYDAFDGCLDLEYLNLGKVEYIATGAFSCHNLLLDQCEMEHAALKTVVMSPNLKEIGTQTPNTKKIESAYAGVFDGQGDFEGLVLPSTLEKVGAYTFIGCSAIKEFTMTENLKFVGSHAFDGCKNLTKITFADSAKTKFEDEVFKYCTGLTEVNLPSWLESVPVGIFCGCSNLASVTFSEGIEEIGGIAFSETAVTSVVFPESCKYIYDSAFQRTPITSVKLGSQTVSIGSNVFINSENGAKMTSVYVPESVRSIGEKAFGYYKYTENTSADDVYGDEPKVSVATAANHDFILYGGTAAKRYAEENGMIYGGKQTPDTPDTPNTPDIPDKPHVYGDIDGDGKVSAKDSMNIQRYVIKLKSFDEDQLLAADVNGDGKVTAKDALEILRHTLNMSENDKIGQIIV